MTKKKIASFVLSLGIMSLVVLPTIAMAQAVNTGGNLDLGIQYGTYTGLGTKDVRETVSRIINVALGLLGIIAVVIILIGGFEWMTTGGNEEKAKEARNRIIAGIIGLAIILMAYAIAQFVINKLTEATTT